MRRILTVIRYLGGIFFQWRLLDCRSGVQVLVYFYNYDIDYASSFMYYILANNSEIMLLLFTLNLVKTPQ